MASHPLPLDPRGVRFGQALTGLLLVLALAVRSTWTLLAVAAVLTLATLGGARWNAWTRLFAAALRPALGPPRHLEDAAGPRFANGVGAGLTLVGTGLVAVGVPLAGWTLAGIVAALALLAAATGFCVGCRFYGLLRWLRTPTGAPEADGG